MVFQRFTCDDMKNAGIAIYAVQINSDNEATSRVLQHCPDSVAGAGMRAGSSCPPRRPDHDDV